MPGKLGAAMDRGGANLHRWGASLWMDKDELEDHNRKIDQKLGNSGDTKESKPRRGGMRPHKLSDDKLNEFLVPKLPQPKKRAKASAGGGSGR